MAFKHPNRLWLAALLVAWGFDQLFWGVTTPGISFFIFTLVAVGVGWLLAVSEGSLPHPRSLWLLLPLLFFSAMTAVRQEPMTLFVNVLLTLLVMMLVALTLRSGVWPLYSLSDYVAGAFQLMISAISKPFSFFSTWSKTTAARKAENNAPAVVKAPNPLWGFLRGLLLALPVVLVLAGLLASADPVFSKRLLGIFNWFQVDKLAELLYRAIYITFLAFILLGVYLHSLSSSHETRLLGLEKPWIPPFLGWMEAVVVLGCVDLLFAFFVALQFQYLFGGQANINIEGFTYAEYARRGFSELVAVAVLSLMLFLGLTSVTRRQSAAQQHSFTGMGTGLVALVAVILISAFQRLLLYEQAYGFSRIRTFTHIFMIWLGLLLVATIVLEVLRRGRTFALALALTALGFGLTANLINMDAFIVQQNVNRAVRGSELDSAYLASLSDDAVPAMVASFYQPDLPASVKDALGASLACHVAMQASDQTSKRASWQSPALNAFAGTHYAAYRAKTLMRQIAPALAAYPVTRKDSQYQISDWIVSINGVERSCQTNALVE